LIIYPSRIQGQKDSRSLIRIPIKEFKYFYPNKLFLSFRKYDSGCSFRIRIRILIVYPSRIQGKKLKRLRIPDPKYIYPKKLFLSCQKYDLQCSSWIWILDPDLDYLPIPDPGVKKALDPGSGSATLVSSGPTDWTF
jgi:hypothetical protein